MRYYFLMGLLFFIFSCSKSYEPKKIEGKINVSSKLASKVGASDVLYVFLYENDPEEFKAQDEGRAQTLTETQKQKNIPLAVLKIAPLQFPVKLSISEKDILFPDRFKNQAIYLAARVSKSGKVEAVTGEIQGAYKKNPVHFPDNGIYIELDQEFKSSKN